MKFKTNFNSREKERKEPKKEKEIRETKKGKKIKIKSGKREFGSRREQ